MARQPDAPDRYWRYGGYRAHATEDEVTVMDDAKRTATVEVPITASTDEFQDALERAASGLRRMAREDKIKEGNARLKRLIETGKP